MPRHSFHGEREGVRQFASPSLCCPHYPDESHTGPPPASCEPASGTWLYFLPTIAQKEAMLPTPLMAGRSRGPQQCVFLAVGWD